MTDWLGATFTPADFGAEPPRRPVLTVEEASERQETARLAMVAAEEAFKAARAAFRLACRDHADAKRNQTATIAGEVALFDLTDATGGNTQ